MSEINKDGLEKGFSVHLSVVGEDPVKAFEALVNLKALGYADASSTITYNRVCVPAGYCEDFGGFIGTYSAILTGDHAAIYDQVPEALGRIDAIKFLARCSNSLSKIERTPITENDVATFLEFRAARKGNGQK